MKKVYCFSRPEVTNVEGHDLILDEKSVSGFLLDGEELKWVTTVVVQNSRDDDQAIADKMMIMGYNIDEYEFIAEKDIKEVV